MNYMNKMSFDIGISPPTADLLAQLLRERDAVIKRCRRLDRWIVLGMGAVAAAATAGMAAAAAGMAAAAATGKLMLVGEAVGPWGVLGASATAITGMAVAVAAYSRFVDDPRTAAQAEVEALDLLPPDQCPSVLALCQQHPALAAYQAAVLAQRRELVIGEARAMEGWVSAQASQVTESQRADLEHQACMALKQPVHVGAT